MHWCQWEVLHHSKLKAFDSNKGDTLRLRHWWTKSTEIRAENTPKRTNRESWKKYCTSKNADSCLNFEDLSYFLYCRFLVTIFFKFSSRCSLSQQKLASELVQWIVPVKSNKNSVCLENKVKKKAQQAWKRWLLARLWWIIANSYLNGFEWFLLQNFCWCLIF